MQSHNLELTGVFVQDSSGFGYTAFFAQFPNIIAEGDTEAEAAQNLFEIVKTVFEHQKNINLSQNQGCDHNAITTKQYNLSFA